MNNNINAIPVFLACDEKYAKYATVTMVSILSGTSEPVDLYILDGGIAQETKIQIQRFLKSHHANLHHIEFIVVNQDLVRDFPSVQHFSLNTYFRYFIAELKPEIHRALYIDSDMVIIGNIAELYNTDMHGLAAAAVPYICNDKKFAKSGHHKWIQAQKEKLHMSPESLYFNAGLMIMDLDWFRKNKMQNKLVQMTLDWKDIITCPDQDILNMVFENKYEPLTPNFNIVVDITDDLVNINKYANQFIGKKCTVIHYTGGFGKRPWTGSRVLAKHFWRVAKHTPFYHDLRRQAKYRMPYRVIDKRRTHIYFMGKKIATFAKLPKQSLEMILLYRIWRKLRKTSTVCYTYLSAGYDNLMQHRHISFGWDYVCFTNDEKLLRHKYIGIWKIEPSRFEKLDSKRNCGWHKTQPEQLFSQYERSIWIDANINIMTKDFSNLVKNTKKFMLVPLHHDRECIYDEIEVIREIGFDTPEMCDTVKEYLTKHKMPHQYGQNENNIIFRMHTNPLVQKIDKQWWELIRDYSKRDQLSFSYCLYKNGVTPYEIAMPNIRYNEWFYVRKHNKHHD